MTSITIELAQDRMEKLKALALETGMSAAEFLEKSVEEWLKQPEKEFQKAVNYVLNKNKDLYRRLA
jgi:predicted transcriptional regulator